MAFVARKCERDKRLVQWACMHIIRLRSWRHLPNTRLKAVSLIEIESSMKQCHKAVFDGSSTVLIVMPASFGISFFIPFVS